MGKTMSSVLTCVQHTNLYGKTSYRVYSSWDRSREEGGQVLAGGWILTHLVVN